VRPERYTKEESGAEPGRITSMTESHERTSAGGVVVKHDHTIEVCLIRPAGRTVWGLPKGGVEAGETFADTAVREVAEETGIQSVVETPLGVIDYSFYSRQDGGRIHKTVHYFLMRAVSGNTADHDHEVSEARWMSVSDALSAMTYPNEREIVRRAAEALEHTAD
jgi:ADP-ribose pyrophosphatase YjhB (NUDIX family)